MELVKRWQGRTSRLPYLSALIVSSAAIFILPFGASKIAMASAAGVDPAMAIVRALLGPLLLGIGFLAIGGPLLVFTRRRLRELGLSGVWLLLFPIGPLQMLFTFAVASSPLGIWPLTIPSPVTGLPFWFEVAFGALLAVLPSRNYLEHSPKQILRFAHFATTCEGRLGRQAFVLHLAIAFGLTIISGGLGIFDLMRGLARPGAQSVSMLAGLATLANALLTVLVTMFVTASTVRRLHDLNQRGWWIILFPFGLPSVVTLALLAKPVMLTVLFLNPFTALSIAQGLGCLILLVWLLSRRGSDLDNSYGLSANMPHLTPSSA